MELGFEKAVYTVSESMADNPDVAVKVCVTQTGGPVEGVESVTVTVATRNGSAFGMHTYSIVIYYSLLSLLVMSYFSVGHSQLILLFMYNVMHLCYIAMNQSNDSDIYHLCTV